MNKSFSQIQFTLEHYQFNFPDLAQCLKCAICNRILINAKQTSCGCRMCGKCIEVYLSNDSKKCPSDSSDCNDVMLNVNEDVYPDNATNKVIGQLEVKCPLHSCSYMNSIKNMAEHLDLCEFREIFCKKCQNKFIAKDKEKHDKNTCDMRMVSCQFCHEKMEQKNMVTIHLNPDEDKLCDKFIGTCPNKCNEKEKINVKEHLKSCSKKKLECPFHSLNCNIGKMEKENLLKHMKDEDNTHMSSIITQIDKIESSINNLQSSIDSYKDITQELLNITNKGNANDLKILESIKELEKEVSTVDKSDLRNNGNFIWKINDFDEKVMEGKMERQISLTSDPFYTSEFGYKLRLRIYPYGNGVNRRTHLSIYFEIMSGKFDDILSWPFKHKVVISILDQKTCQNHRCETIIPDSSSACYQKPIEECNDAVEFTNFILLSELTNESDYFQNGTIYLKISVNTN